jgi:hypothetical protein
LIYSHSILFRLFNTSLGYGCCTAFVALGTVMVWKVLKNKNKKNLQYKHVSCVKAHKMLDEQSKEFGTKVLY